MAVTIVEGIRVEGPARKSMKAAARIAIVDVLVAGIIMMIMMAMVVDVIVTGVVTVTVMVVGVNVANAMRRMVRRMVRRRTVNRRAIGVDVIARSNDVDRRSYRKGGENESNENFELHICLEY
jgi:hypothetical protein